MTLRNVLIALIPEQPARSAARAGSSMRVILGVIFAQKGFFAAEATQPQTSSRMAGSSPMADPIRRSNRAVRAGRVQFEGVDALAAWQRSTISIQASLRYSSMTEAMRTRSGKASLHRLNSSSQTPKGRSLISSMFSQPMTSLAVVGVEFRVTGRHVDDLGRIEADQCLRDHGPPALPEGPVDHAQVRPRRPRGDDEGIGQFQAVDGRREVGMRLSSLFSNPMIA